MENIKNNSIVSEKIMHTRNAISDAINNPDDYLMSVIGPCPLTDDFEIIKSEAILKTDLGNQLPGLISLDRQCFTKPRSNPNDWQGLDSTNPDRTLEIISNLSNEHANVTAEIRFNNNLLRYAAHLSMVWTGARNVNNKELMKTLALYDESLPIGIKNDLDGNIDTALEQINYINQLRQKDSAPAVLIYRGGENAIEPQSSSIEYKNAWDATGGEIIRDNAHGTEMAHHPNQEFKKSIEGQIMAARAAIELARQGYPPLGLMYEASSIESIMDPHMPVEMAIKNVVEIHNIKIGSNDNKPKFKNLPSHGFGSNYAYA